MNITLLSHLNYIAILVASIIFFFLGSLWFSFLFKSLWVAELQRHNIIIREPSKHELFMKMLLTFTANFIICFALAYLLKLTNVATMHDALCFGLLVASIAASVIGIIFVWVNMSIRLFIIDAGYSVVGIIITSLLLSVWK